MRLPVPNLLLCHRSNQLFDLRSPSSTDVLILLLKQPIITCSGCLLWSSQGFIISEQVAVNFVAQWVTIATI